MKVLQTQPTYSFKPQAQPLIPVNTPDAEMPSEKYMGENEWDKGKRNLIEIGAVAGGVVGGIVGAGLALSAGAAVGMVAGAALGGAIAYVGLTAAGL